jgi:hypothetical protein
LRDRTAAAQHRDRDRIPLDLPSLTAVAGDTSARHERRAGRRQHGFPRARSSRAPSPIGFLATSDDRAFEAAEIARQTGLDRGVVSKALSRLKTRRLVVHEATDWAVVDDRHRLREYDSYTVGHKC